MTLPGLRDVRLRIGMSGKDLAERLDVHFSTIYKWEDGGKTSQEVVGRLAKILGVKPAALLPRKTA